MSNPTIWNTSEPPKDRQIVIQGIVINGRWRERITDTVRWSAHSNDWMRAFNKNTLKQTPSDRVVIIKWLDV